MSRFFVIFFFGILFHSTVFAQSSIKSYMEQLHLDLPVHSGFDLLKAVVYDKYEVSNVNNGLSGRASYESHEIDFENYKVLSYPADYGEIAFAQFGAQKGMGCYTVQMKLAFDEKGFVKRDGQFMQVDQTLLKFSKKEEIQEIDAPFSELPTTIKTYHFSEPDFQAKLYITKSYEPHSEGWLMMNYEVCKI